MDLRLDSWKIQDDPMAGVKTILLIDDNEADNVYHGIVLRRHSDVGEVAVMESASDVLHYLQHNQGKWPDLVFVDLNMPGMDGIECIEKMVRLAPPPDIRIFLLTSSDAEQDRNRANQLPVIREYLIKPLTNAIVSRLLSS